MRLRFMHLAVVLALIAAPAMGSASAVEKIRNEKVVTVEVTLAPGELDATSESLASMVVYMAPGKAQMTNSSGAKHAEDVKEGEAIFQPAQSGTITNAGSAPLHYARIEFLTTGRDETWGMTGLSPNYKMLLENRYARAYDIRIPAQTFEPQHTHHDRVVVSLQGAQLEHILPNGEKQPSTLQTGEIVWRLGATHVGHNLGHTDLWVIAIEPK
jgi:hypothetical protein